MVKAIAIVFAIALSLATTIVKAIAIVIAKQ
jgi:hypothetical protein